MACGSGWADGSRSSIVFARWCQCAQMGGHIGATWRILLNRPSAAAMRSYVKLLWRLVFLVLIIWHVLRFQTSRPACSLVTYWTPDREEVEDGAGQGGHGRIPSEKICKKWEVAVTLMKPGALPLIVLNGNNSSPSVLAGTGGPKSKTKYRYAVIMW